MKRNLTVHLGEEVIGRAKVLAAEWDTSVSGLVAQQITELFEARDRYAKARDSALPTIADVSRHASELDPAAKNLGRTWTREELHDERLSRYDQ